MLHTGDLFHHKLPIPGSFRLAYHILKRLSEGGIPVYMIRGNHDTKQNTLAGTSIDLMADLGLVTYLDDKVVSHGSEVVIFGVGHYTQGTITKRIDSVLKDNKEILSSDKVKIFALHNFVQGQLGEDHDDVTLTKLESLGFDYVGAGHYHIPWSRPELKIYTPGSLEATSSNDWRRGDAENGVTLFSSFYEVEITGTLGSWNSPIVRAHKIPVRPKVEIRDTVSAGSYEELEAFVIQELTARMEYIDRHYQFAGSKIHGNQKMPIVKIRLQTNLPEDQINLIDRQKFEKVSNALKLDLEILSSYAPDISREVKSVQSLEKAMSDAEYEVDSDADGKLVHLISELSGKLEGVSRSSTRSISDEELDSYVDLVVKEN